jgi:hypothetical protein
VAITETAEPVSNSIFKVTPSTLGATKIALFLFSTLFICGVLIMTSPSESVSEFSPVQCKDLVFFHKMWLTAYSAYFDKMTFLVASMTYCFLKLAVMRIVSLAIATIVLFIVT